MSRYIDNFPEEIIIKVLRAYLLNGDSHRDIQKNILGIPAPARGGGFITMDILHHFDIKAAQKGILGDESAIEKDSDGLLRAINKIKEYNELEDLAKKAIEDNNIYGFNSKNITEVEATTKQRIGQSALRDAVLKNYSNKCAICGIHQSDLLVCSHIKPWIIDTDNRLNPSNAIIFCSLHDRLFDKGYFSLDSEYEIIFSDKSDTVICNLLKSYKFKPPKNYNPNEQFLKYHRVEICEIEI